MSAPQQSGMCVWNAFGEYSCKPGGAGAASVAEFFAPKSGVERFEDAAAKGGLLSKLLRPREGFSELKPKDDGKEGFCGCQAAAGNF